MVDHTVDLGDHGRVRLLAFVIAAGCYSPTPPAGAPCGLGGECPTGLTCSPASQTCELRATDAPPRVDDSRTGSDAFVATDGRPLDAARTPWTLVQTAAASATTLTIAASGQGNLIVVALQLAIGTADSVSDNAVGGSNDYVAIPTATCGDANTNAGVQLYYAASSAAGATTITAAVSPSAIVAWEVAGMRSNNPVDTSGVLDSQAASMTPFGPTITTDALGDFVVSIAIVQGGVSDVHAGNAFTNDHKTRGNGWAHLTNAAAPAGPYQAEWDQNMAGTYCSSAVAFFPAD